MFSLCTFQPIWQRKTHTKKAEAYADDVSDLFERYHGTPDQSFGIWLKDGETSYYEFLSKATGLRA
jgi:hypothetical protein